MNPFQEQAKDIEKTYKNWKSINMRPYDKETVDPYTRVRTHLDEREREFEAIWNTARFTRALHQQRRAPRHGAHPPRRTAAAKAHSPSLKPIDESVL